MSFMAWKQNVGIGNLDAAKARELLKNFRYPTEINKNYLKIRVGASSINIGFETNGSNSSTVGVKSTPMNIGGFLVFVILLCLFVVPGFIYSLVRQSKMKNIFYEAIQVMNQNASNTSKSSFSDEITAKLTKLKEMKEQGVISEEEFNKKKSELIEKL